MIKEFDNNVLDLVLLGIDFIRYECMRNFEKFEEELRSKEEFYISLTNKKFSDKVYEHVLNVWNRFEMKMMKDYHNLYLKCDVLLLADMFEKFRNNSFKNYGLCPSHFLSSLGLSWDAMLKTKKVELELSQDPDMYIFFEKGIRGGISYICNRYGKAINRYLISCDPKLVDAKG